MQRGPPRDEGVNMSEAQHGLEGVVASETEIAEPDKEGSALRYRGVDIEDLVGRVPFENVWGLLVDGSYRPGLPPAEPFPLPVHSGDIRVDVQSAIAMLAPMWGMKPLYDTDDDQAREDLGRAAVMVLSYVAQAARGLGQPMVPQSEVDKASSITERFMIRWQGEPNPKHVKAIDAYWASAAEHGMNASTFTARVVASTGADVGASLSAAVGAMSGPLHGGAPSRVLGMLDEVERRDSAAAYVRELLDGGQRLMGFGHRVYRAEDPRARVLRRTAKELSAPRYEVAEALENAAPTGCWRPTSSSGPRSCSTSPRSRHTCSPPCSPARAPAAGRPTSWNRSTPGASSGPPRSTSDPPPARPRRSTGGTPPGPNFSGRPADEAQQLGLRIGVAGYLHSWAVLTAGPKHLVDGQHSLEQQGTPDRVEGLVLAGRPRQIPGVHEDVGGVELVDRTVQRNLADMPVAKHLPRCGAIVEERLHSVAVHYPRRHGIVIGGRAAGQFDATPRLQERRKPLHEMPHHVACPPPLDGSRVVPGTRRHAPHPIGENPRDLAMVVCCAVEHGAPPCPQPFG